MAGLLDALLSQQGGGLLSLLQGLGQQQNPNYPDIAGQMGGQVGGQQAPILSQQQAPQTQMLAQAQQAPQQQPQPQMQPQQAMPPQPQAQPQPTGPDMGDRLTAGTQGFLNAKSPLQALGNLFAGIQTGQRSDPQGMQQQQQFATYKALIAAGVPAPIAQAATLNPEILKTISPAYFDTAPKLQETGTDPITGQKSFSQYRPAQGTLTPIGGGQSGGTSSGMLAPGVTQLDHSLSGDAYLNQFGPEVQAAVKAYINGDVMPTGNPRLAGIANVAKTIAQKYGQDTGVPVSDATYSQRRTYRSQIGSNAPNSVGGQAKAFNQGIEHMGALADTLEKLDNSNGLGIPMLAQAVNSGRQAISTEQSAIADKARGIGQTLAGEVGKLFSGSSGGGVHERELTRERFDTVKSKPQLAAALEATLETMQGGLTALEQRRDEVMGPNSGIKFVSPETEQKISKIQETISRLKGTAAPQAPSDNKAAAPSFSDGATATNPQTGAKIKFIGGQWVPQ